MQQKNKGINKLKLPSNSNTKLQPDRLVQCKEVGGSSKKKNVALTDRLCEVNTNIHGLDEKKTQKHRYYSK